MVVTDLEEWGLVLNIGGILDPWFIFVMLWPKQTCLWIHHWPLGLGFKKYERTQCEHAIEVGKAKEFVNLCLCL